MNPKRIRKIRGRYTQLEFAVLLGVSQQTVYCWEKGRRRPRGTSHLLLLLLERDKTGVTRMAMEAIQLRKGRS